MLRRPAPAARFLVDPAPHSRVVPARRDRLSNAEKEPVLKGLLGCSAVVAGESEDGLRAPCRTENKSNGVRAKSDPGQARRRLKQDPGQAAAATRTRLSMRSAARPSLLFGR